MPFKYRREPILACEKNSAVISSQLSPCWNFCGIHYQSWVYLPLDPLPDLLLLSVLVRGDPCSLHSPGYLSEDPQLGLTSWKQWWEIGAGEEEKSQMSALSFYATAVSDSCCVFPLALAPATQALLDLICHSVTQWSESLGSSNTASCFCLSSCGLVAPFVLPSCWVASLSSLSLTGNQFPVLNSLS